ncbi:hypothetical protein K933_13923 [Candidatus Halobonum tyrrellensis G22]|uniref:Uncharacterized protein n=1 Tax=Candidatus Halobonum tyrrellensis G22 TaxID=1324957 RepID=V4H9U3_9EURY|nr:hypothetical protein K933_13923 [Candidatus Halobonum tyrrellensis G22]
MRSRLRSLAADGLGCLVTGHVPTERYREETRKLFGAPDNPRLRTVLLTCPPAAPDGWFPGELGADHPAHEVVTLPNVARGRAATATPGGPAEPSRLDDGSVDRDRIEAAILDAVRSVERRRPGVSGPLTFRFGLHRWDVFDHDVPDAPEVLDTVLGAVHDRRGLSHVHYPRQIERGRSPLDDPVVSQLYHGSDELDVVVELRVDGETGETQQRWRVPGRRLTGWSTL